MAGRLNDELLSGILEWYFSPLFCVRVTSASLFFLSTGPVEKLSKTKRVRIVEEVILEDESKPKKKKRDGKK